VLLFSIYASLMMRIQYESASVPSISKSSVPSIS